MTNTSDPSPDPRPQTTTTILGKPAPPPATTLDHKWSVSPLAVIAWVLVQIGCLSLALLHVPLAAKYPVGTTLSVEILILGQIGGSALLASSLFCSPATAVVVVVSVWPTLILAGGMAARPISDTLLAGLLVSLWVVTLFFWTSSFSTSTPRQIVSAFACLLAIGMPLLVYLLIEFGPAQDELSRPMQIIALTPTLLTWSAAAGTNPRWTSMIPLALMFLLGVSVWLVPKRPLASPRHAEM